MKNRIAPSLSGLDCIFVYYFLSLCALLTQLKSYTHLDYNSVTSTGVYVFRWIEPNTDINAILSFICPPLMVLLVILLFYIRQQWARVLWALLFFLVEAFSFSYVLGHSKHMYIWINLFFALIPGSLEKNRNNHFYSPYIRAAQLQIFVIYGLAGVWKLKAVVDSFSDSNIAAGFNYVPYAIAWEIINSNRAYAASLWVLNQPVICFLLASLVLVSQCGSILVAFLPRFYFIWGLVLVLFHIGTLFTVNVFFLWSIPPILLFLCFYQQDESKHGLKLIL